MKGSGEKRQLYSDWRFKVLKGNGVNKRTEEGLQGVFFGHSE